MIRNKRLIESSIQGFLERKTFKRQDKRKGTTKKQDQAAQNANKEFEDAFKPFARVNIPEGRNKEELARDREMFVDYSRRTLQADRALGMQLKLFVQAKWAALNELPPELRTPALSPRWTFWPKERVIPALTPPFELMNDLKI